MASCHTLVPQPCSRHSQLSAASAPTASCRLVVGIDNNQPCTGANKSGAIRMYEMDNRSSDERIVLRVDFSIERYDQLIQCRRNTRWV